MIVENGNKAQQSPVGATLFKDLNQALNSMFKKDLRLL